MTRSSWAPRCASSTLPLEGPLEAAPWVNLHSGLTSPWPLHIESFSTMKLRFTRAYWKLGSLGA